MEKVKLVVGIVVVLLFLFGIYFVFTRGKNTQKSHNQDTQVQSSEENNVPTNSPSTAPQSNQGGSTSTGQQYNAPTNPAPTYYYYQQQSSNGSITGTQLQGNFYQKQTIGNMTQEQGY